MRRHTMAFRLPYLTRPASFREDGFAQIPQTNRGTYISPSLACNESVLTQAKLQVFPPRRKRTNNPLQYATAAIDYRYLKLTQAQKQMRYFVAVAGAVFIFVAVFFASQRLRPHLPKPLCSGIVCGPFRISNIVGTVLGPLAAIASFQGTLRTYRKKEREREQRPSARR